MQNRFTFWLTLATTLAIGMYGVISALYFELQKHDYERNGANLALLIVAVLVMTMGTVSCFVEAFLITTIRDDDVSSA